MSEETSVAPASAEPLIAQEVEEIASPNRARLNDDERAEKATQSSVQTGEEEPVTFAAEGQKYNSQKHGRTNSWNFIWDASQDKGKSEGAVLNGDELRSLQSGHPAGPPAAIQPRRKQSVTSIPKAPVAQGTTGLSEIDYREQLLERREREFDRREREIDRRERELERRERELERRQREFDQEKARWTAGTHGPAQLDEAVKNLKKQLEKDLLAERKRAAEREAVLEAKIMSQVNDALEKERQFYGLMRMSDNEVNAMVESSVGYLLQNDEGIADRIRFQSLIYLSQEKLASQAGLSPPQGSDSLSLAWRLAVGPSVVTEERYKKALELLENKELESTTKKLMDNKKAMEYVVEYTSHLRKDGAETNENAFGFGRIPREDYMESVKRQSKDNEAEYEALKALVDFIYP